MGVDCKCVSCDCCNGSGDVEYRTGMYPETELETCPNCRGRGIEELCEMCANEPVEEAEGE